MSEQARSRIRAAWPGLAVFVVAAVVLAALASRVRDWAVMTDELLYERLALAVADGGLPRLHGDVVDALALLYPLLLAPVFAIVALPEAVAVAHGLNGVLFASAAVPAFLLARELALHRFAAVAAAVFATALPWTVIGAFVLTEAAAYPAALWALLAIQRAVALPSPRRDAVALAAIGIAALARPQLAALGLVLVAASVAHELRFGRWRAHLVSFAAGGAGLLLLALGGAGVLGTYAPAVQGQVLSGEAFRSAVVHLDVLAVAIGIVPLLLGLGWAVAALVRPSDPRRLAFAGIVASAVVVLALVSGSVVVRFGLGLDVKDRYLFYVAPLLFLATACALEDSRARVAGVLGATAFFVATVGLADFDPVFGVNVDSPASTINEDLATLAADAGLASAELLSIAGGLAGAVLVFLLRRRPSVAVGHAVLALVVALVAAETAYAWNRLLSSSSPSGRPLTAAADPSQLAWVDATRPRGTVGMLPYSLGDEWFRSAAAWWDVEFWNASVTRAYVVGNRFAYTPEVFPRGRLELDSASGAIAGGEGLAYLVRTTLDARFAPVGLPAGAAGDLELVDLDAPLRAQWLTIGLDPDGWTRAARPALVRVFPPGGLVRVTATVTAPELDGARPVALGEAGAELASNESRELAVEACVPEGGYADVPVHVEGSSSIPAISTGAPRLERFRNAGVRLSRIAVAATGRPC